MTLIEHKKGGVKVMPENILFPKGKAVEITDEALAEKILRNPDFFESKSQEKKKKVKE